MLLSPIVNLNQLFSKMSEYYILKPAVGTKETGMAYPAVESYDDYDFNSSRSVHKLTFREFPDIEPDIRFKLAKGAKLCDVMGQAAISAHGLLISKKAKEVFSKLNIAPHEFYPSYIEDHKGNIHNYYWMHLVWKDMTNFISYHHSSFYKRKFSNNLGELSINSDQQFWQVKEELGSRYMIGIDKIKLEKGIDFHIFPFPYSSYILIKESAINQVDSLSGLDISPDNSISTDQAANHLS